eukprot:6366919-Prymnesium_polylepis.1
MAVQFAIDELKRTVPIWKKEVYREGEPPPRVCRDLGFGRECREHAAQNPSLRRPARAPRRRCGAVEGEQGVGPARQLRPAGAHRPSLGDCGARAAQHARG